MAADRASLAAAETLFEQVFESYRDTYKDNAGLEKALGRFRDYHDVGASILDVGCGAGGPASHLAKLGLHVTGIDISQKAIDYCQGHVPGCSFEKADMTTFDTQADGRFDGVVALFSLGYIPYRDIYAMIFKMASWLRPGGTFLLGTVPAEELIDEAAQQVLPDHYLELSKVPFMGSEVDMTVLTTAGWLSIIQEAGFFIRNTERHVFKVKSDGGKEEKQLFITAERSDLEPLFGPYPLPSRRRPPHSLSEDGWRPFAERLTRHEFDAAARAVESNKRVLDVGSGHGELPILIAQRLGQAYAVEPNAERNTLLVQKSRQANVIVEQGTAESLPFGDHSFDAVVALWVLHYVDDLDKALKEMLRVVDPAAPNARIVIVQGAPENEIVRLLNRVCAPIAAAAAAGEGHDGGVSTEDLLDHQGFLLARAAEVFSQHGFADISLERVYATCRFPEEDLATRCEEAAAVFTDFWHKQHPRAGDMREGFRRVMNEHFARGVYEVKDQAVMMVARAKK